MKTIICEHSCERRAFQSKFQKFCFSKILKKYLNCVKTFFVKFRPKLPNFGFQIFSPKSVFFLIQNFFKQKDQIGNLVSKISEEKIKQKTFSKNSEKKTILFFCGIKIVFFVGFF